MKYHINRIMDIKERETEALGLLKRLIETPSISRDEARAANIIEAFLKEKGFTPIRKGNNVWALSSGFSKEKQTVLLNSHIDTVKPVEGWETDPYQAVESVDRIIGLGTNDATASLVSLLQAFLYLNEKEREYNLLFLASAEEEISGANGVESVLPQLPPISFGVVGEPTSLKVAIAEKGLIVVDCTVKGKAGHAAHNTGDNAIYKSLDVIRQVQHFILPKTSHVLGNVKFSVTMIEAGHQHNVIPDLCSFVIDIRTNELYSNKEVLDLLRPYLMCELKPRSLRLNSSRIDTNHPVVNRAKKMGLELFGSHTMSDQALMSFPTIKIGPGDSTRSHTANEYILKSEINRGIATYIELLDNLKLLPIEQSDNGTN